MEQIFFELNENELFSIDGGVKPSSVCLFVAGFAACFVHPALGVPFFLASFDYEAA